VTLTPHPLLVLR